MFIQKPVIYKIFNLLTIEICKFYVTKLLEYVTEAAVRQLMTNFIFGYLADRCRICFIASSNFLLTSS